MLAPEPFIRETSCTSQKAWCLKGQNQFEIIVFVLDLQYNNLLAAAVPQFEDDLPHLSDSDRAEPHRFKLKTLSEVEPA